jgi:hypothetical protein
MRALGCRSGFGAIDPAGRLERSHNDLAAAGRPREPPPGVSVTTVPLRSPRDAPGKQDGMHLHRECAYRGELDMP